MLKYAFFFLCLVGLNAHAKTNAVIESWTTHIRVDQSFKLVVTETKRITVLNEDGYWLAVYFNYYDSYRKIKGLKYNIIDAAGNRLKRLGKSDAVDVMFNATYEVADARLVILDPEYRSFPFTAEIITEIEYDGYINIPDWEPRYAPGLEVRYAEFLFEYPQGFRFRSMEVNGVAPPISSQSDNISSMRWTVRDLKAIRGFQNRQWFSAGQPKVLIAPLKFRLDKKEGEFTTWQNFGDWYLDLNEGRNELSAKTKAFLDQKRSETSSIRPLVTEVYRYMQARTRYVSIQLGIGGFQAIASEEVDKTGYGDCKALTNYMKAMLNYLEIPSNFILVNAGEDVDDVIADFPSNQFNHVFLGVPIEGDTLLLECTSQISPPDYIGSFTDDRNVLWISRGKSKVIRTPAYKRDNNQKLRNSIAVIDSDGNAQISVSAVQSGVFFDDAMYYKSAPEDRIASFNYKKFNFKDFTIKDFDYSIPNLGKPDLNLKYEIVAKGLARRVGDKLIINTVLLPPLEEELEIDLLNKKCVVRRGFTIEDETEIVIPENFWTSILPSEVNETSDYGSFSIKVEQNESNRIIVTRKIVVRKGNYDSESFAPFYNYLKRVKAAELAKIVFQSKT